MLGQRYGHIFEEIEPDVYGHGQFSTFIDIYTYHPLNILGI